MRQELLGEACSICVCVIGRGREVLHLTAPKLDYGLVVLKRLLSVIMLQNLYYNVPGSISVSTRACHHMRAARKRGSTPRQGDTF